MFCFSRKEINTQAFCHWATFMIVTVTLSRHELRLEQDLESQLERVQMSSVGRETELSDIQGCLHMTRDSKKSQRRTNA